MQHGGTLFVLLIVTVSIGADNFRMIPIEEYHEGLCNPNFVEKMCRIASKYATKANYIYSVANANSVEVAFESAFQKCFSEWPVCRLELEEVEVEPRRHYSTLNVFLLPEEWSFEKVEAELLRVLKAKQSNKHTHYYMFVWHQQALEGLFHLLWSKGILNVVAFNSTRPNGGVFTYEPFTAHGFELRQLEESQRLYYDKLRNLRHHQLRISMFTDHIRAQPKPNFQSEGYTAVDGHVASTIIKVLNATARYLLPMDGHLYGTCKLNYTCTGTMRDVVSQRTDVAFNMRYALAEDERFVEVLYPLYARKLSLIVPASPLQPESLLFVRAFTNSLWRLLVFNFIMASICFYLLQHCANQLLSGFSKRLRCWAILELIFKLQFGEPLYEFTRVSCLRLFVVSWILCNYVITSVYFAKLESSFVHKTYEPDLKSVAEFENVNLPIYAVSNLLELLRPTLDPKFRWILKRAVSVPQNYSGVPYGLEVVKKTTKVAFIFRREIARDFLANTFNSATGRPMFHSIPQYIFSMPRSYIVTLGSPYRDKFESIFKMFFEHGIMQYWLDTFVMRRQHDSQKAQEFYETLGHNLNDITSSDNSVKVNMHLRVALSVEILQGAFYLWSFGVAFSLLAFAMEHMHRACKKWRRTLGLDTG